MKATICLEYIGERQDSEMALYRGLLNEAIPRLGDGIVGGPKRPRKPWIAKIVGRSKKFGLDRQFLESKRTYARSNSTGSRGVELWFTLDSGCLYEIKKPLSWKCFDRYFCIVKDDGEIERIQDAEKWLKTHLE